MPVHSIAVCGAGPAGLAAALLLHRDEHRVRLFERFESARPVGSGLLLQPTGLAVLQELGLAATILQRGSRSIDCRALRSPADIAHWMCATGRLVRSGVRWASTGPRSSMPCIRPWSQLGYRSSVASRSPPKINVSGAMTLSSMRWVPTRRCGCSRIHAAHWSTARCGSTCPARSAIPVGSTGPARSVRVLHGRFDAHRPCRRRRRSAGRIFSGASGAGILPRGRVLVSTR